MKYLLITAGIFIGELLMKNHVEEKWEMRRHKKAGLLNTHRYHNYGAFLNLGEKNRTVVTAVSVGLTAGLFVFFVLTLFQTGNQVLKAGLSLLLGGAFSNTYDRLSRKYVVDYFSFQVKWEPLRRIVFNLADFCILIGALMAALSV